MQCQLCRVGIREEMSMLGICTPCADELARRLQTLEQHSEEPLWSWEASSPFQLTPSSVRKTRRYMLETG